MLIPAGSRVQSVPGPGQTAQVFETSADLTAVIGWNALPAQTTIRWQLAGTTRAPGSPGRRTTSTWATRCCSSRPPTASRSRTGPADFHYVTAVTPDPVSGNTQIWWDGPISGWPGTGPGGAIGPGDAALYVFRKKAALYGVQAPSPQVLSGPNLRYVPGYQSEIIDDKTVPAPTWDYTNNFNNVNQISLDALLPWPGAARSAGLGPAARRSAAVRRVHGRVERLVLPDHRDRGNQPGLLHIDR